MSRLPFRNTLNIFLEYSDNLFKTSSKYYNISIKKYLLYLNYKIKEGDEYMKQEYTVKEVFDKNSKTIEDKLQEIFISFLIEKINS